VGTISSSGLYTAPSAAGTDTVTAISNANNAMSSSSTVTITPGAPPNAVSLLHFGNAGFGGNDTNVFLTALNSTASNGQTLEIPAGNYNISPLTFPRNSNVFVDSGVTVSAIAGYGTNAVMLNIDTGPVTITGAGPLVSVFQMPSALAASESDSSQFRHCLEIGQGGAASNVTISGIACNQSGGDGIYIRNATNVLVENSAFNGNYRNGASITGAVNGVTLIGDTFNNNCGTLPKSGIDFEPNLVTDFLENISLQNNTMSGNCGDGLEFSLQNLTSASQPVSITVTGNATSGNTRYGYVGLNTYPTNPTGTILVQNSSSTNDGDFCAIGRFWQAGGELLSFQNLTCTNPHVNGPDPSNGSSGAVGAIRGGGATIPMGNISYTGTDISAANGQTTYYFDFEDYSGIGITNVVFDSLGTMTGATKAPNGLVQGVGTNAID
jgi:hypothetical protein